jgi:hypothetical protein
MAINFPEGTQNLPSRAVQVVSATKRNAFSTTSTSMTDVPGLSVSITPKASDSKILIFGGVCFGHNNDGTWLVAFRLVRNSTDSIMIGDADGSRGRHSGGNQRGGGRDDTDWWPLLYLDSPSTTSATTYKIRIQAESPRTVYVNRGTETDGNQVITGRFCSTITAMEIAQ